MAKKYRLKQSVKEGLIAVAIFMAMFLMFWRIVLFGYPSDLESGAIVGSMGTILIGSIFKGGLK